MRRCLIKKCSNAVLERNVSTAVHSTHECKAGHTELLMQARADLAGAAGSWRQFRWSVQGCPACLQHMTLPPENLVGRRRSGQRTAAWEGLH